MSDKEIYKFKIVLIGDGAVGKTALARTFVSRQFQLDYRPTIGTNVFVHRFDINPNVEVSVSLFDIAGQEKWSAMRNIYYKGSQGAFLVTDLTRPKTFESISDFWFPDFEKYCPGKPVVLIANKRDLDSKTQQDLIDATVEKVKSVKLVYTSALTGENCEDALKSLVEICVKNA